MKKRPLGVSIISCFYLFGAFVLLVTVAFDWTGSDQYGISERFGLPGVPEPFMRVLVAAITLFIVYGYYRLSKWGFWLMVSYSLLFGAVSVKLLFTYNEQPFIGNAVWSAVVLVYTFFVRKAFFQAR